VKVKYISIMMLSLLIIQLGAALQPIRAASVEAGGSVTLVLGEEPSILNPFSSDTTAYDWAVLGLIFEGPYSAHPLDPFDFSEDFPLWLEEMPTREIVEDPVYGNMTKITLHIKQGVKFHDGTPMDADDVKFSYDFALWLYEETGGYAEYYYLVDFASLVNCTKVDDYTVELYLATTAIVPYYLAFMEVFPKHIFEKASTWNESKTGTFPTWTVSGEEVMNYVPKGPNDPIFTGTGPFKMYSYDGSTPDTSTTIVLKRFDYYHLRAVDENGTVIHPWKDPNEDFEPYGPYVDTVIFNVIKEPSVMVEALIAGTVDYASEYELGAYVTELQDAGFEIATTPRLGFGHVSVNCYMRALSGETSFKAQLLRNAKFRQALAHAIDKNKVVSDVWKGYAIPIDSPIPPSMNAGPYNWSIEDQFPTHYYDADPNASRAILEDLGLEDPDNNGFYNDPDTGEDLVLEFYATQTPSVEAIAEIVKDSIEAAGIKVNLHLVDFTQLISTILAGAHDISFFGFVLGRLPTFTLSFSSYGFYANYIWYWQNTTLDNLALSIIFEDETWDDVLGDVHAVQEILFEELPLIPIYQNKIVSAYDTDEWAGFINLYGSGVDNYWTLMKLIKVTAAPPMGFDFTMLGIGLAIGAVVVGIIVMLMRRKPVG